MAVGFGSYLGSTYPCGLCVHLGSVNQGDSGGREHLLLVCFCQMFPACPYGLNRKGIWGNCFGTGGT